MSALPHAGRRALVTGASSGIGRAIALGLAAEGADLVVHHHGQPDGAADTVAAVRATGRRAEAVAADFTQADAAREMAERVLATHGPVDILIANAAIERRRPWQELDAAAIGAHLQANITALVEMLQVCLPPMSERGWGRVVAIGSIMATRPRSETLSYAALKSAQLTAVRAVARDVAAQGVTLNVVSPGAIRTERMAERYDDPAFVAAVTAKIPAGRPGTPEDIAAPVLMLCGDAASYITGADIPVDGGWGIGDAVR